MVSARLHPQDKGNEDIVLYYLLSLQSRPGGGGREAHVELLLFLKGLKTGVGRAHCYLWPCPLCLLQVYIVGLSWSLLVHTFLRVAPSLMG